MPINQPRPTTDVVVVFDLMRDAARHLIAQYTSDAIDSTLSPDSIAAIRAIRKQVTAVDPFDADAQRQLTEQFRARLR